MSADLVPTPAPASAPTPAPARTLAEARSLLFVPGNRPERFQKALDSGADAVILDLEDAVPAADKAAARAAILAQWPSLDTGGRPVLVRINAQGSAEWGQDLALLPPLAGLGGVVLPKAESAQGLAELRRLLGPSVPLLPLIESVAGFDALAEVAAAPGVLRLVLGHIDFLADSGIDCDEQETELNPLRFAIALATRRAGLPSAVDGVTVQTGDEARLHADTQRARRFGFGAKLCIHPRQPAGVHQAFAPTAPELDWARRVLAADAASGGAAVQLDGRMVDLPVVLRARRTLARAG